MQVAVYATPAGGGYEISVEAEYGGNYIITGLIPGDYEIRALFIEVIGGEPQTPVEATNEIYPVAVVAGQNTAEIDIHLLE